MKTMKVVLLAAAFLLLCPYRTLALDVSRYLNIERYTILDSTHVKYEIGHLLASGSFKVILSSTETTFGVAINDFQPINGRPIMLEIEYDGYKNAGAIPRWTRSRYTYDIGASFFSYVIVSVQGGADPNPKPYFTDQPEDQQILAGDDIFLYGNAEPWLEIDFQWFKNGLPIRGETSRLLFSTAQSHKDSGRYTLQAKIGQSTVLSRTAVVTVIEPVAITRDLKNISVKSLGSVALTIKARGTAPFSYQWFHNNSAIPNATKPRLALRRIGAGDAGEYYVRIANALSSVNSSKIAVSLAP